jgi:hypothetical protein
VDAPGRGLAFDTFLGSGTPDSCTLALTLRDRGADLCVILDLPDRHTPMRDAFVLDPFLIDAQRALTPCSASGTASGGSPRIKAAIPSASFFSGKRAGHRKT